MFFHIDAILFYHYNNKREREEEEEEEIRKSKTFFLEIMEK